MVESIRAARKELADGHVVCIFAEGAISRTGNMLPFKRGLEQIVDGTDVPIIPVHLDRSVGQHLQLQGRQVLLEVAAPVPVSRDREFGTPLPAHTSAQAVRQAIQGLRRMRRRSQTAAATCWTGG